VRGTQNRRFLGLARLNCIMLNLTSLKNPAKVKPRIAPKIFARMQKSSLHAAFIVLISKNERNGYELYCVIERRQHWSDFSGAI
jgi:hypothetical protein